MSEADGGLVQPAAELRLEPLAASVRAARRFLRERLRAAGREAWSDGAELALSEVVTNGVLHAHTELVVRVTVLEDAVQVEVSDANPSLPVQRRSRSAEATTGRGLELVAALTQECGVRPEPHGKVVWFRVGEQPEAEEPSVDDLLASWDADSAWEALDVPAADDLHEVVLRGLPTTLWMAAREHHQSLLRELVLFLAEHPAALPVPPDLVRADEARNLMWAALVEEIDKARAAGRLRRPVPDGHPSPLPEAPGAVDLHLRVPAGPRPGLRRPAGRAGHLRAAGRAGPAARAAGPAGDRRRPRLGVRAGRRAARRGAGRAVGRERPVPLHRAGARPGRAGRPALGRLPRHRLRQGRHRRRRRQPHHRDQRAAGPHASAGTAPTSSAAASSR